MKTYNTCIGEFILNGNNIYYNNSIITLDDIEEMVTKHIQEKLFIININKQIFLTTLADSWINGDNYLIERYLNLYSIKGVMNIETFIANEIIKLHTGYHGKIFNDASIKIINLDFFADLLSSEDNTYNIPFSSILVNIDEDYELESLMNQIKTNKNQYKTQKIIDIYNIFHSNNRIGLTRFIQSELQEERIDFKTVLEIINNRSPERYEDLIEELSDRIIEYARLINIYDLLSDRFKEEFLYKYILYSENKISYIKVLKVCRLIAYSDIQLRYDAEMARTKINQVKKVNEKKYKVIKGEKILIPKKPVK